MQYSTFLQDLQGTLMRKKNTEKNYVDVELRIPSIEKAEIQLGFKPKVSLDEGIIKTYNWYKKWLLK